jgi:hypothetical protein
VWHFLPVDEYLKVVGRAMKLVWIDDVEVVWGAWLIIFVYIY